MPPKDKGKGVAKPEKTRSWYDIVVSDEEKDEQKSPDSKPQTPGSIENRLKLLESIMDSPEIRIALQIGRAHV